MLFREHKPEEIIGKLTATEACRGSRHLRAESAAKEMAELSHSLLQQIDKSLDLHSLQLVVPFRLAV